MITQQRRRDHLHITPVLIALHWLPVPWRITYKILVLTFRALHNLAPEYIADMIVEYMPSRHLRSAGSRLLRVPRHNLEHYGRRGFSVTSPRLWNNLPDSLHHIDSFELFKSNLKTHLFKAASINYLKVFLSQRIYFNRNYSFPNYFSVLFYYLINIIYIYIYLFIADKFSLYTMSFRNYISLIINYHLNNLTF